MGTLLKGTIFGPVSGKVGNLVYFNCNGISCVRSQPEHVNQPNTAAQINQREKFKLIIQFLQPIKIFLCEGFKSKSNKMSPFNAAMSYNCKNAIVGTFPNLSIDYSKVLVSYGSVSGALNPEASITPTGEIEFTWEDDSNNYSIRYNDKVMLLAYSPDKQKAVMVIGGNVRETGRQIITLPPSFVGDEVQCYIAFQNFKQTAASDSQYVGSILVK